MQTVKTVISIEKNLFDQAEEMARTLNISRSRLFAVALQDFLEHQKNKELLARINAAHDDEPDVAEQTLRRKSGQQHRSLVEGFW